MDASPDLWTSAVNYWNTLREGTRDNIIGGLLVAVVVTVGAIFRNTLRAGFKRIFRRAPEQTLSPARHEVVIKVETPQTAPAPAQHTPSLPSQPEPRSTATSPQIPRHPISFVPRRDKEDRDILNVLRDTLAPHDNRLVTLCGPGGVGKTRLAIEATRLLGEAFARRVIWASADGRFDESLKIKKRLGDRLGAASTLHQLGRLAEDKDDKGEAARLFRESLSIFERLGSPYAEVARRSLARVKGEDS